MKNLSPNPKDGEILRHKHKPQAAPLPGQQAAKSAQKYSVVTSFNRRIFESPHQLIFKSMKRRPEIPFFVYHENSFDIRHNGAQMLSFDDERSSLKAFDLFVECAKMDSFIYGEGNPFDTAEGYWNRNSKFWVRKVFTIADAINKCETQWLIWADADLKIVKKFDDRFWSWIKNYDIAYIQRDNMEAAHNAVETGFICFRVNDRVKRFVNDFLEYYLSKEFTGQFRWDDSWGFTYMIGKPENADIRKGWFGNKHLVMQADNISPFYISEYLAHSKGPLRDVREKEGPNAHDSSRRTVKTILKSFAKKISGKLGPK